MTEDDSTGRCTIGDWQRTYREEQADPAALLGALVARLSADDPAWITRADAAFVQAQVTQLDPALRATQPLWGVPFAVKDNIDVAGLPTTGACPAFAYTPQQDAAVVARLRAAGAIVIGKTNLDQFATGLVGTRSPYGDVPNTFVAEHVSGGSSSGSASVVARGLVPFALGTDTAGSGRVPAGFNNLVGWKPTLGRQDMAGVLPACRSLDVVSVFALTVADAAQVAAVMEGPQTGGPQRPGWLRRPLRIGIPRIVQIDAGIGYDKGWAQALAQAEAMGAQVVSVDLSPFEAVAALLYDGPWVAERYAVVQALIESNPEAMDATVRAVIEKAKDFDAVSAFKAQYRLTELAAQTAPVWQDIDLLMVPTAPTCPTRAAVAADPVARNSELGRYTNFVNLLGLAALALPVGFSAAGLPFGVTFIAPGGSDAALAGWGHAWEDALPRIGLPGAGGHVLGAGLRVSCEADRLPAAVPASAPSLLLAVVGAHLEGLPLHGQLTDRSARLVSRTRTAAQYRLHALPGTVPPKPGLARVADGEAGASIEVEVYEVPQAAVGSFLAMIPSPLGLGSVQLADGQWVHGFICEPWALVGAPDISAFGGWRAYLASLKGEGP
jgi:allophanate hydrolase